MSERLEKERLRSAGGSGKDGRRVSQFAWGVGEAGGRLV